MKLTEAQRYTEAEWRLREDFRRHWDAFCNCDPFEGSADFIERMEAAGFIFLDAVNDDDLQQSFCEELGIHKGGSCWRLTDAGRAMLSTLSVGEGK